MAIRKLTALISAGPLMILCLVAFPAQPSNALEAQNGITSDPVAGPSLRGPVPIGGPWIEFGFAGTGSSATGCLPADPGGIGHARV